MSSARAPDPASPLAAFADGNLPPIVSRLRLDESALAARPFTFRFCVNEVPFEAKLVRRDRRAVLSLTGALGVMPFSAESAKRRRRLAMIVAAARRRTHLKWAVSGRQEILVSGDIEISDRITPTTALAGAISLMLRARPYADLIVSVSGEA
jgi:hypothetical protein